MKKRCAWTGNDPLYIKYHDEEWGVPIHDDRKLFEFLILEGAQAGLSWITILKKRENFRKAFENFDPHRIAAFDSKKVIELLADKRIIRNRLKINAAIKNAGAFLEVVEEFGSFDTYIWKFAGGSTIKNAWTCAEDLPAETEISKTMSRDLKKRGFKFVGPIICYAFMQAVGMVNDHTVDCFRY
jgi:DNA-3-methyladenine glycosylase I